MGKHTGGRTRNALKGVQQPRPGPAVDLNQEFASELGRTRNFLDGDGPPPSFGFLATLCEEAAHANCTSVTKIDTIDFSCWRLATELRLLDWRILNAAPKARRMWSSPSLSQMIHLAISLTLTDRAALASPIFQRLAAEAVEPVLDDMALNKKKVRDWGAIGFAFRSALDAGDVPKPFAGPLDLSLEQAQLARPTYCDARDSCGSLLGQYRNDLIPVELIFLARSLGHPAAELAALDAGIRATGYPEHEAFQEIDIALSIAGL